MRNIYMGSLFKFDGGICGKLYFKNAFYSPQNGVFKFAGNSFILKSRFLKLQTLEHA